MNHCASWAGNNVSTTCLKKGVQPSKMLNILYRRSVLEGAEQALHGYGSTAVASTELKEQSAGVKF